MTAILDAIDAPLPEILRFTLAIWFGGIAAYLLWCGIQLQREQAATDRLASGGLPPALTHGEPPPAPAPLPRRDNAGKASEPGGIPHPERLRVERAL